MGHKEVHFHRLPDRLNHAHLREYQATRAYNRATLMFEHALRGVLAFAYREATREGATELGPGHLLIGLRLARRQTAARLLANIPVERARAALAPTSSEDAAAPGQADIPRSPDAERVIRRAVEAAGR